MLDELMLLPTDLIVRHVLQRLFASTPEALRAYETPVGDPGLFGPRTVTWRIHADFPGMMSGGLCALLLQTLHPLALGGVWDHSNFREDLLGRLRRTTAFVAASTYAPRAMAQAQIAQVRRIHERVTGTLPDGRAYQANDPALLTWVHVTEMWSFLAGYRAYAGPVPPAMADRYFDETARVAEALGARDVPRSAAAVATYFERMQSELAYSERSAAVVEVLRHLKLPGPALQPARALFLGSGAALLPDWAQRLMGRRRRERLADQAARLQLRLMSPLIRRALRRGISARACARVGLPYEALRRWPEGADATVSPARAR